MVSGKDKKAITVLLALILVLSTACAAFAGSVTYTYDATNRLIYMNDDGSLMGYVYDKVGNLKERKSGYLVTASVGQSGSLDASTSSPQIINSNDTTSFTFNANSNYHIGSIDGCWGTPYTNTSPSVTSHSYSTGQITANCTVTATFVINPPVADFTSIKTPTSGEVPLKVQFTDSSTLSPISWYWDFGDGASSIEQNPVHVFETVGTGSYTVTLTATNGGGSSSPVSHTVTVSACSNAHSVKLLSDTEALYDSVSAAYAAAADGGTIQSQAITFTGNITVDKNITFDGGYDCQISLKIGYTTIQGTTDPAVTITTGSAIFDGIVIK